MNRRNLLIYMMLLPVGACASGYHDLPMANAAADAPYTLGPGDELRLAVYGFDTMSQNYVVSDSGAISLPMLGSIHAEGLSSVQLEQAIAGELKQRNLANDPNVSVEVSKYRPFYILGEVQRPGQYPYVPGMTLLTAVSVAGGYTFRADKGGAAVSRTRSRAVSKVRITPDSRVMPGDVITVAEAWF